MKRVKQSSKMKPIQDISTRRVLDFNGAENIEKTQGNETRFVFGLRDSLAQVFFRTFFQKSVKKEVGRYAES